MKACYHTDVCFSDPVFPNLRGMQAGAMWDMLVETLRKNSAGWKLEFGNVRATITTGSCRWEAHYKFSLTGRKVHNIIEARFRFQDGKIIQHTDAFDFYHWTKMAFGGMGVALGWTPFFKKKIQKITAQRLSGYMNKSY